MFDLNGNLSELLQLQPHQVKLNLDGTRRNAFYSGSSFDNEENSRGMSLNRTKQQHSFGLNLGIRLVVTFEPQDEKK